MTDYSKLYAVLKSDIQRLETKFISSHIPLPVGTLPDTYELDVRAYCVLSHAAFEQYVEDLCFGLAKDASEAWITNRHCSQPLLGLMIFHGTKEKIELDETKPATTFFDYVKDASEKVANEFLVYLKDNNNGVSEKYLRKMLAPVALNVPDNPKWLGSLKQLANQRGDNAHRSHANRSPSPTDSQTWVEDCMELWADLRDKAKLALNRPHYIEEFRHYVI